MAGINISGNEFPAAVQQGETPLTIAGFTEFVAHGTLVTQSSWKQVEAEWKRVPRIDRCEAALVAYTQRPYLMPDIHFLYLALASLDSAPEGRRQEFFNRINHLDDGATWMTPKLRRYAAKHPGLKN